MPLYQLEPSAAAGHVEFDLLPGVTRKASRTPFGMVT
jgi:hypothetical protein